MCGHILAFLHKCWGPCVTSTLPTLSFLRDRMPLCQGYNQSESGVDRSLFLVEQFFSDNSGIFLFTFPDMDVWLSLPPSPPSFIFCLVVPHPVLDTWGGTGQVCVCVSCTGRKKLAAFWPIPVVLCAGNICPPLTATCSSVTVLSSRGWVPSHHTGWMWSFPI